MDKDMQPGHEHAAWTIPCSMDLDVDTDIGTGMDMDTVKLYSSKKYFFCGCNGHCRIHLIEFFKVWYRKFDVFLLKQNFDQIFGNRKYEISLANLFPMTS
jgi:hypothetical protein